MILTLKTLQSHEQNKTCGVDTEEIPLLFQCLLLLLLLLQVVHYSEMNKCQFPITFSRKHTQMVSPVFNCYVTLSNVHFIYFTSRFSSVSSCVRSFLPGLLATHGSWLTARRVTAPASSLFTENSAARTRLLLLSSRMRSMR